MFKLMVAMLAVACIGADEIRLPADAAGLSAGASGLRAGVVRAHGHSPRAMLYVQTWPCRGGTTVLTLRNNQRATQLCSCRAHMKLSCAARGAAVDQFMAAVEEEHAAMAATSAAYADHQRHLLQASAGGGGTTASLASNLPTTMAAMGARMRASLSPVSKFNLADAAKLNPQGV